MNFSLRDTPQPDNITLDGVALKPAPQTKFLGVILDPKLNFTNHIDSLKTRSNFKIFIMLQLKRMGLNIKGLTNFYCACIRSILIYGAPAWFYLLSQQDRQKLESIQRSATRLILPNHSYEERLQQLTLPTVTDFIEQLSNNHFCKILSNNTHPLYCHLCFNENRSSSRKPNIFYPPLCRTKRHEKTFLNHFTHNF
jgi:hypothetical protein